MNSVENTIACHNDVINISDDVITISDDVIFVSSSSDDTSDNIISIRSSSDATDNKNDAKMIGFSISRECEKENAIILIDKSDVDIEEIICISDNDSGDCVNNSSMVSPDNEMSTISFNFETTTSMLLSQPRTSTPFPQCTAEEEEEKSE